MVITKNGVTCIIHNFSNDVRPVHKNTWRLLVERWIDRVKEDLHIMMLAEAYHYMELNDPWNETKYHSNFLESLNV
jgi:hypothetical protein